MFRHKPRPVTGTAPPLEPIEGFFFAPQQQALAFGANRTVPVSRRPALSVKRRDGFVAVLPATSKAKSHDFGQFFALSKEDVRWVRPESRATFLYCRYETVAVTAIGEKIGVVSQNARMDIARWLHRVNG
jgi:hypothetical protein